MQNVLVFDICDLLERKTKVFRDVDVGAQNNYRKRKLSLKYRPRIRRSVVAKVQAMMLNQGSYFGVVMPDSRRRLKAPWQARKRSTDANGIPDTTDQWGAWLRYIVHSTVEFGFEKPSSL